MLFPYDELAWDKNEDIFQVWLRKLRSSYREIGVLVARLRGGIPIELCAPQRGSFNACMRIKFQDGGSVLIRLPCPGKIMFPDEKTRHEVAVMRFIEQKTSIPVPHVVAYGMADENPTGLGPFIIMDYIPHTSDLSDVLNTPSFKPEDRPLLNPDISPEKLEYVYSQMADILLELSAHSFSAIGSLSQTGPTSWSVTSRPLTYNMNELVECSNFPPSLLPSTPFQTSTSYFRSLAQTHLDHFSTQRNNAIRSVQDCQQKYVARHLFLKAMESHFHSADDAGPFKLFCDDLRPANVLVDASCKIVAVIDWEFCYAAPAEFTHSPPWWLLIETPECYPRPSSSTSTALDAFLAAYAPRLETFLRVLEAREHARGLEGTGWLSDRMRQSWADRTFWVGLAARKSYAFDNLFWWRVIGGFFGGRAGLARRMELLGREEREGLEGFVERKVREMRKWGGGVD